MIRLLPFKHTLKNILEADGEAYYIPDVFTPEKCAEIYADLLSGCNWQNDVVVMFGKTITTRRKTAWHGEPGMDYTYSGIKRKPSPYTPLLLELKGICENLCNTRFNACLLNLYHDGQDGMALHSDNEKELGINPVIASLSFGANRRFLFRHTSKPIQTDINLENGSLLVMGGACQHNWKHSLPKSTKVKDGRINVTFRTIKNT